MVRMKKNTMSKKTAMDVVRKNAAQNFLKDIGCNAIYGTCCSTKIPNLL